MKEKRFIPIVCSCSKNLSRQKYGINKCDTYSFCYSFGNIFANGLLLYIDEAKKRIKRDDWDIIEKHAKAIREYVNSDSWDKITTVDFDGKTAMTRMFEYEKKEKEWREAMFWLTENWNSLWW